MLAACRIQRISTVSKRSHSAPSKSTSAYSTRINRRDLASCCCGYHRYEQSLRKLSNNCSLSDSSVRHRSKHSSGTCYSVAARSTGPTCPCNEYLITAVNIDWLRAVRHIFLISHIDTGKFCQQCYTKLNWVYRDQRLVHSESRGMAPCSCSSSSEY